MSVMGTHLPPPVFEPIKPAQFIGHCLKVYSWVLLYCAKSCKVLSFSYAQRLEHLVMWFIWMWANCGCFSSECQAMLSALSIILYRNGDGAAILSVLGDGRATSFSSSSFPCNRGSSLLFGREVEEGSHFK